MNILRYLPRKGIIPFPYWYSQQEIQGAGNEVYKALVEISPRMQRFKYKGWRDT